MGCSTRAFFDCFIIINSTECSVFHESMMQYDVASTIAYIFGLRQPQVWIGRPMTQVFR